MFMIAVIVVVEMISNMSTRACIQDSSVHSGEFALYIVSSVVTDEYWMAVVFDGDIYSDNYTHTLVLISSLCINKDPVTTAQHI